MGFRILLLIGVLAFGWFLLKDQVSPARLQCISIEDDVEWSFRNFRNTCDEPVYVRFCQKLSMGELGQLFGMDTGDWSCTDHNAAPGQSFMSIKWTHEQSSAASVMLSTSRYVFGACRVGYGVLFKDDGKFECQKR